MRSLCRTLFVCYFVNLNANHLRKPKINKSNTEHWLFLSKNYRFDSLSASIYKYTIFLEISYVLIGP